LLPQSPQSDSQLFLHRSDGAFGQPTATDISYYISSSSSSGLDRVPLHTIIIKWICAVSEGPVSYNTLKSRVPRAWKEM
jgi:hypothetical protein